MIDNAKSRYDKRTARRYSLKLNINTDPDIIKKLENVDNVQAYIKSLIRKDLKTAGSDTETEKSE